MFLFCKSSKPIVNGEGKTIGHDTKWFRVARISPAKVIALGVSNLAQFALEKFRDKFSAEFSMADYEVRDEYKGDMEFGLSSRINRIY